MEIDVRDMPYYIAVEHVAALDGKRILVVFNDGNCGIYDMGPLFGRGVFKALCDEELFRSVHVSLGAVTWNDQIDIPSERLWTDCEPLGEDWRPKLLPKKYFVEYDGGRQDA